MITATAVIRATGDARTPLWLALIMNVVNVMASVTLAFGWGGLPALGLIGVGWGTVVARSVGGVLSVAFLAFSGRSLRLRPDVLFVLHGAALRRIWRLSVPALAERVLISFASLLFIRIVAFLGTDALAAHNIAIQVESLAFMPAGGLAVAVATVVGQAIGGGRPDLASKAARRALVWAAWGMAGLGLALVAGAPTGVRLFGATPDVLRLAGRCLQIGAMELPFLAFALLLSSVLRAAGDTASPLYVTLVGVVLFRLGAVWLLAVGLDLGLPGVWLGTALDWAARSAGLWVVLRRGRWQRIHAESRGTLFMLVFRPTP
jgi:putative MATE family efflux protein